MSTPDTLINPSHITKSTPRARHGAAAVIAQYIQDLSHPSKSEPSAAVA
jgi:hypothetical protein